jgi:hypothetical protein
MPPRALQGEGGERQRDAAIERSKAGDDRPIGEQIVKASRAKFASKGKPRLRHFPDPSTSWAIASTIGRCKTIPAAQLSLALREGSHLPGPNGHPLYLLAERGTDRCAGRRGKESEEHERGEA